MWIAKKTLRFCGKWLRVSAESPARGRALARERKDLGAAFSVIVIRASPELKKHRGLLIELALDGPEFARYAVTAIPAHLLGTAAGLRKGLDPNVPKNLMRAVVFSSSDGRRTAKRRGA